MEPLIHFKDMASSPALVADIQNKVNRLLRTYMGLTSCRVTVEGNNRGYHGIPYRVCVDVTLPGAELVVANPSSRTEHIDVYVALRDAFRSMRRELLELRRKMRGEVKAHAQA